MIVKQEIRAKERPHPLVETLSTRRPHGKAAEVLRRIASSAFYFHGEWGGGGSEGEGVLTCDGFLGQGETLLSLKLVIGCEDKGIVLRDVSGDCHSLDCELGDHGQLILRVGEGITEELVGYLAHWIASVALIDGFENFTAKRSMHEK